MAFSAHTDPEQLIERFDEPDELERKLDHLAECVRNAKHFIVFTGAGVSTSAGIPDFRGPQGVWTLAAQNKQRSGPTTRPIQARPTQCHMALVGLQNAGIMSYLVSQNCDGLHRKSGIRPDMISELHGNSNIEECEDCGMQYFRDFPAHRLSRGRDHFTGRRCVCGGRLLEWTIDFGQNLPVLPLEKAFENADKADVCLVLGSSLTVRPACTVPKRVSQHGRLFICNLQRTPIDQHADTVIHARTDVVMTGLCQRLGVKIPQWRLRRRFIVESIPLGGGRTSISIEGREAYQDIPATLWEQVRIGKQVLNKEPYETEVAKKQVDIKLTWMGWYNEPVYTFSFTPNARVSEKREFVLAYLPMRGEWEIETETQTLGEAVGLSLDEIGPAPQWEKAEVQGELPQPLLWPAACLLTQDSEEIIAVSGGTARTSASALLSLYSPQRNAWRSAPALPSPRWGHSLSQIGPWLYLFGGWDHRSQYNDMRRLDINTMSIEDVPYIGHAPPHRSCHTATVVGHSIYIFGGACCVNGPYQFFNDLWRFSTKTNKWRKITTTGTLPAPRSQHAMINIGNDKLLLIGGYNGDNVLNDTHLFDLNTGKWTAINTIGLPFPQEHKTTQNFRVSPVMLSGTAIDNTVYVHSAWGCSILHMHDDLRRWKWRADQSAPADLSSLGLLLAGHSNLWYYKSESSDVYRLPLVTAE